MTIQGAMNELVSLLKADDIPFYYKGCIEKVIETIDDYIDGKDGYVKRKTEPIDRDELGDCNICKYVGLEHRCNQCVNGSQFYKVEDEPQTERSE